MTRRDDHQRLEADRLLFGERVAVAIRVENATVKLRTRRQFAARLHLRRRTLVRRFGEATAVTDSGVPS